jgi:hypothetical protein
MKWLCWVMKWLCWIAGAAVYLLVKDQWHFAGLMMVLLISASLGGGFAKWQQEIEQDERDRSASKAARELLEETHNGK